MFGYELKKKKPKAEKRPVSFSKKILIVAWISGTLITIYGLWITTMMVIFGFEGDVSIVLTILGGAFAEISAATAFFFWKDKNVSINKQQLNPDYLKMEMEEDFADKYIN